MVTLISFKSFLEKELKNPEIKAAYDEAMKEIRFALALVERREELGLTQEDIAARTGIKQPMISRYEKGQIPNTPTLQKLAVALHSEIVIGSDGLISIRPVSELKAA